MHSAGIQGRVGARAVLMRLFRRFDTITEVFADGGYTGTLIDWAQKMFGYDVEVVKRNELHSFKVLPQRWIVERSFAWMGWSLTDGMRGPVSGGMRYAPKLSTRSWRTR